MIIVLSPAKTLEKKESMISLPITEPQFLDEAEYLVNELRKYDEYSLSILMKTSPKLTSQTRQRFQEWSRSCDNAVACIGAFKGEAYRGLDAGSFSMEDHFYANAHLRILSGLYGVLRPFDGINFYRLEMGTKLKFDTYENLYEYWMVKLTENIMDEVYKNDDKTLVNLASNEYFKSIENIKNFEGINIVTPVFKENRNGQYKVISTKAKRARGLMASYIIRNQITCVDDIKKFNYEGYEYDDNLSCKEEIVFTREAGWEERQY